MTVSGNIVQKPGRDRGVIFQQDVIFMWRNVYKNVEYGLEIAGLKPSQRRDIVTSYLKMVNLEDFASFYPKELSGGMRKRVIIAAVFANNPDVLLMDEPFGALDYPTKIDLQNKLLEIWDREKKTTLFITHDLEEALYLSDRIIVLRGGKIAKIINVTWQRPRNNDMRAMDEFNALKYELWRYLE